MFSFVFILIRCHNVHGGINLSLVRFSICLKLKRIIFRILHQGKCGNVNKFHLFSCFSLFYESNKNILSTPNLSPNIDYFFQSRFLIHNTLPFNSQVLQALLNIPGSVTSQNFHFFVSDKI